MYSSSSWLPFFESSQESNEQEVNKKLMQSANKRNNFGRDVNVEFIMVLESRIIVHALN